MINLSDIPISYYPRNVVPKDAEHIIGVDLSNGVETTVKGFFLNGVYHIQEIIEVNHE